MRYPLLFLVSLLITAGSFYQYVRSAAIVYFIVALLFLALTVVFGALFLSGRVNKTEDIHITE
jgi:hypothetical protein